MEKVIEMKQDSAEMAADVNSEKVEEKDREKVEGRAAPAPTLSQIEARLAKVRSLQDSMSTGESYLDKIGRRDPKSLRYDRVVLNGLIDWRDQKSKVFPNFHTHTVQGDQ